MKSFLLVTFFCCSVSVMAKPYCFSSKTGELKCIDLSKKPPVSTGGGGCGSSSACGNNSYETGWLEKYVHNYGSSLNDKDNLTKTLDKYNHSKLQIMVIPEHPNTKN